MPLSNSKLELVRQGKMILIAGAIFSVVGAIGAWIAPSRIVVAYPAPPLAWLDMLAQVSVDVLAGGLFGIVVGAAMIAWNAGAGGAPPE